MPTPKVQELIAHVAQQPAVRSSLTNLFHGIAELIRERQNEPLLLESLADDLDGDGNGSDTFALAVVANTAVAPSGIGVPSAAAEGFQAVAGDVWPGSTNEIALRRRIVELEDQVQTEQLGHRITRLAGGFDDPANTTPEERLKLEAFRLAHPNPALAAATGRPLGEAIFGPGSPTPGAPIFPHTLDARFDREETFGDLPPGKSDATLAAERDADTRDHLDHVRNIAMGQGDTRRLDRTEEQDAARIAEKASGEVK